MRGDVLTTWTSFVIEDCFTCGMHFAMTKEYRNRRLEDKKNFFCPQGHSQCYVGKTEAEKERERADRLERDLQAARGSRDAWRDQAEAAERSRRATAGQVTKLRNRVANGVCPCCKRTFVDLHRHMAGQHPDFAGASS